MPMSNEMYGGYIDSSRYMDGGMDMPRIELQMRVGPHEADITFRSMPQEDEINNFCDELRYQLLEYLVPGAKPRPREVKEEPKPKKIKKQKGRAIEYE